MISHLSLHHKSLLSEFIDLQTDDNGFEFIVINHPKFDAVFALHGAHLLHFQLKKQAPTIWLSKSALYNEQKAIRGGVPICWPWFGAADKSLGDNLPAHGIARTSKWAFKNSKELTNGLQIEFLLKDTAQTREIWPYQFELTLKATLTDTLQLDLISKNTGDNDFSYNAALHTYLNISAPESCQISGLNKHYADKLNAGQQKTGDGSLQINAPIDSIYQKAEDDVVLSDNGFHRQLHIKNTGNDSEVLWTPWVEGAQAFADMPDNGYQTMFCIESAITRQDGQNVAAGETHTLSTVIN